MSQTTEPSPAKGNPGVRIEEQFIPMPRSLSPEMIEAGMRVYGARVVAGMQPANPEADAAHRARGIRYITLMYEHLVAGALATPAVSRADVEIRETYQRVDEDMASLIQSESIGADEGEMVLDGDCRPVTTLAQGRDIVREAYDWLSARGLASLHQAGGKLYIRFANQEWHSVNKELHPGPGAEHFDGAST